MEGGSGLDTLRKLNQLLSGHTAGPGAGVLLSLYAVPLTHESFASLMSCVGLPDKRDPGHSTFPRRRRAAQPGPGWGARGWGVFGGGMREEEEAVPPPSVISLIVLSRGFQVSAPGISIQLTDFAKLV